MNKIYKVIWCQALCTWIAVSELTKGKVKSSAVKTQKLSAVQQQSKPQIFEWKLKAAVALLLGFSANLYAEQGVSGGVATGSGATAISACNKLNVPSASGTRDAAKAIGADSLAIGCNANAVATSAISIGGRDGGGFKVDLSTLQLASVSGVAANLMLTSGETHYNGSLVSRNSNSLGVSNAVLSGSAIAIGNRIKILNGNTIDSLADLDDQGLLYDGLASAKAIAIGDTVTVGSNSATAIAIGDTSSISNNAREAIAIGAHASASKTGGVALGAYSTTATAADAPAGATIGVINLGDNQTSVLLKRNFAGSFAATPDNAGRQISVGSAGKERQIKNVAPGIISKTSTDAINGSQLVAVVEGVVAHIDDTAAVVYTQPGGTPVKKAANGKWYKAADINQDGTLVAGATEIAPNSIITSVKSAGGSITAPTTLTNVKAGANPTDAVNVSQLGTAVSNASLNFEGDVAATGAPANNFSRKVGETTKIVGGLTDPALLSDSNIGVVSDGAGKLTVKLAKNLQALDSVSITGGPTMNNGGINMNGKKITNLAAGTVSSTSQDAVNGSQLYNVSNSIKNSIGGNTIINPDGSIATVNLGDTGQDNIHDALKTINNTANNANKGWKLSTNGGTATQVVPDQRVDFSNSDNNVKITNNGSNVTVNLNNNLDLSPAGSVTMGNTTVNNGGLTIQNADPNKVVSVTDAGINAGNNKVTNVQDGLIANGSKDAVNGGQIKNIADSIKNSIGGNTVVNPDGTITTNNIGNTGANNIHDAISNVNTAATKAKTTVTQGANIVVTPSTNLDGSTNYQVATAKDVSFDNVNVSNNVTVGGNVTANAFQAGNTTVNNGGVTIANADPNKVVSVTDAGINAGNNKVTNVAPGAISATSKDAVNGSQLNASNNAFNTFLGGGAVYNDNTKTYSAPTYVINNGTTTSSYNNVGDALGALNQADTKINSRIDILGDQLEQSFRTANNRIDDVEKLANAGVAAAMSLENAPYIAGKFTYAVGAAYHGGENAVGATLRRTADNGRWSLTGGVAAASQGDPSIRIGISGVID